MDAVQTLPAHEAFHSLSLPDTERNLFSSPDWVEVLRKAYNLRLFIKYIERDGKIDSYIIYSVVRNFLEWKICICSYCDYCDCHVKSADDWDLFFQSLRKDYPQYRIAVRNLDDATVRQSPHFEVLSKEVHHRLDVRAPLEEVWARAHDSYKNAVKQAEKNEVVIKRCPKSELRKFFKLHFNLRKHKYRLFAQPYRFFDVIWEQYMPRNKGYLLGAYSPQGRFIAANLYLVCGNTLYYKFNTSSEEGLKLRPNNLLFWEGIKLAKELGLSYVDLGSSGSHQEGLILYKNHTGAQMSEITHLGFTPKNYKFSGKRILGVLTRIFTAPWMPDILAKWGSHIIYPYLA